MRTTSTSSNRYLSRALLLASLLALAACGSSGGSEGTKATATTEADSKATTTTKADKPAADEPEDEPEEGALPTKEADAPAGNWVMVRWLVSQDPEPDGFLPGWAEPRLYEIEAECGDDGCNLTLNPGGDDDSFALPELEPITGPPFEFEPGEEGWTSTSAEEPYGCSDELTGDFVESESVRALVPVRDGEGDIVAMVGTDTYTDAVNAAGEAAGCPETAGGTYEYEVVMVQQDSLGADPTFEVDGGFRQTLEVIDSTGYSDPRFQKGGLSLSAEANDVMLEGSCDAGDCSVSVSQVITPKNTRSFELTAAEGDGLAGDFTGTGGCFDPSTGEDLFEDGAYDNTGNMSQLVPILTVDGEAKVFLGRFEFESEPTAQGRTQPACSSPKTLNGWATLVATDLLEG